MMYKHKLLCRILAPTITLTGFLDFLSELKLKDSDGQITKRIAKVFESLFSVSAIFFP